MPDSGVITSLVPMPGTSAPEVVCPDRSQDVGGFVSSADVQRFRDQGFLVLDDMCTGAPLLQLRAVLMGLFERRAGYDEGNQFDMLGTDRAGHDSLQPQLLKPSLYAPELLHTPYFRRVQAIARQLLGADAQFNFDHSIIKRAGTATATPWHQDEAHHRDPHFQFDQISFWMPLQDVREDNGCMCYLPGSNRGPLLPHRSPGGDARIHALECHPAAFDTTTAIALPVGAGSCILHDGRTLHAALPNRSDADRLVYVLAFRSAPRPRTDSMHFTWLEAQRTADIERRQRWCPPGGYLVLLLRWLRRLAQLDGRQLKRQPQRIVQRLVGVIRGRWWERR
jgi:ectoine hydroxylase-related dioxygenase (phytanoyl-CoA dioxygenase family)